MSKKKEQIHEGIFGKSLDRTLYFKKQNKNRIKIFQIFIWKMLLHLSISFSYRSIFQITIETVIFMFVRM